MDNSWDLTDTDWFNFHLIKTHIITKSRSSKQYNIIVLPEFIVCRVQKVWSYEENKFMVYVTEKMIIGIILLHIPLNTKGSTLSHLSWLFHRRFCSNNKRTYLKKIYETLEFTTNFNMKSKTSLKMHFINTKTREWHVKNIYCKWLTNLHTHYT